MTPEILVRLLAEPARMRVLAAVALDATTLAEVASVSGLPVKDVATALRRFEEHGVIESGDEGLRISYDHFREVTRATAPTEQPETSLHPFVQGTRLRKMPAQQGKRRAVLEHVVAESFEENVQYDERTVNDKLRAWCDGGEVDHVAVRRYLIDMGILGRGNGLYWIKTESSPGPALAERLVRATGLD